jgi:GNAT superfamily N-acetyltransferase
MSLLIRPATAKDASQILHFIKAIAAFEELSDEVKATEGNILKYLFGEHSVASCLLAFEAETCIGFALYFKNFSTFVCKPGIYLEDLFVEPNYRGKGYGKALLMELVQLAKSLDYGRVEWSVLNWNKSAIEFYESIGAKPMSGWTTYRLTL